MPAFSPNIIKQELNHSVVTRKAYVCERHGRQDLYIQIVGLNEQWEEVFNRKYCPFCVDAFFQREFEPLKERDVPAYDD